MTKLAIILSHPVQYYAPLFVTLSKEIELKVFYAFQPTPLEQGKEGFGRAFQWDINLLEGYTYEFVPNIAEIASSAYYAGCDTPTIGESLKEYGATHIVTFGWHLKMYRQALRYAKQNKIPIAVRGDSQLNPKLASWKKIIKRIYYPYFLKQYDAFLSVGKRNKSYLMYYGVSEEKIIFSPHAIDQAFWKVERKKEGYPFVFVWIGKFISLKRPLDVIQAFKKILVEQTHLKEKVVLQMVGSGVLLEEAKRESKDCNQIEFLGFKNQTELKAVYAEANCLILSSESETWGLVVNEAFAVGIPAIVSDACGCGPDLVNASTGKIYPTANLVKLKAALKSIFEQRVNTNNSFNLKKALNEKNSLYSFDRNITSFKEFLENY